LRQLLAASFYGFISLSTTFFNKAVLSNYNFKYTNFILLAQHLFTLFALESMKIGGWVVYPSPKLSKCWELLPISLLYSLNVGVALSALTSLNIPMYGVLKRLVTLFVLVGERVFMHKYASSDIHKSVVVIVAGAIIAGAGDITFDLLAYVMACGSCFAQAAYLIYVAKTGAEKDLNSFGLLFYNSLLAIPFVALIAYVNDEFTLVSEYTNLWDAKFQFCLIVNLALGSLLNYSMFLCTTVNSPLTTTIVGHVKTALSLGISLMFMDVHVTLMNAIGLSINMFGGLWYSHIKYSEQQAKEHHQEKKKGEV